MKKISNTACLLDSNFLVALVTSESREHNLAVSALEELKNSKNKIFISSQNFLELSSVLKNHLKIDSNIVAEQVEFFLNDPYLQIIYPNSRSLQMFVSFLKEGSAHTVDLFLAATALSNGIKTIITFDSDFKKIKGIKVVNPFTD